MQYKILVIDDSKDMRELMSLVFEPEGYTVAHACDGHEALGKLNSESRPDLIFLDHEMGIMNGPDFLQELERLHPAILAQVPIIMLTGLEVNLIPANRATEVIAKQVGVQKLLSLAKRYLTLSPMAQSPTRSLEPAPRRASPGQRP